MRWEKLVVPAVVHFEALSLEAGTDALGKLIEYLP
jgi:hypothetical protein